MKRSIAFLHLGTDTYQAKPIILSSATSQCLGMVLGLLSSVVFKLASSNLTHTQAYFGSKTRGISIYFQDFPYIHANNRHKRAIQVRDYASACITAV